MTVLKTGSGGPEVVDLQARLRELGFDAQGVFGPVTEFAVRRFQEVQGLLPDGIVGPLTRAALEAVELGWGGADRAGRAARKGKPGGSARNAFDWWQTAQPQRIATAYLVERDGGVFEVFDPRFWAYHLGLVGTGGRLDRRSIGIELASEGRREERHGELLAFGRPFGGAVYDHGAPWREQHDGYPPA